MPIAVVAGLAIVAMNNGGPARSGEVSTSIKHAVTAIQIKGDSGDVKVSTGAASGSIELTRRLPRDDASPGFDADETWNGTRLVLDPHEGCGPSSPSCSIDYTLQVPDGTRIIIDVGSGDVQLDGKLGAVDAKTGSGDVKLDSLASTSVTASTDSGDIDASLSAAPDTLTLQTGSGDVKAKLPGVVTYDVVKHTGSGDEQVDLKTETTSVHKVTVNTGSGDIELKPR